MYEKPKSIANTSTSEWRERYVKKDGTVDLWLEDDFNVASRKAGACEDADTLVNIENYAWAGMKTVDVDAPIRNVKVTDHESGEVLELNVPEGEIHSLRSRAARVGTSERVSHGWVHKVRGENEQGLRGTTRISGTLEGTSGSRIRTYVRRDGEGRCRMRDAR